MRADVQRKTCFKCNYLFQTMYKQLKTLQESRENRRWELLTKKRMQKKKLNCFHVQVFQMPRLQPFGNINVDVSFRYVLKSTEHVHQWDLISAVITLQTDLVWSRNQENSCISWGSSNTSTNTDTGQILELEKAGLWSKTELCFGLNVSEASSKSLWQISGK